LSAEHILTRIAGDNCYVKYDGAYYSVPYRVRKQTLILHVSDERIIICDADGVIIACHDRSARHEYVTDPSHLPPKGQNSSGDVPAAEKYINWACHIGRNTNNLITAILARDKYEERSFKTCMGILQLSKKYGCLRLENACGVALYLGCVSYSGVKRVITNETAFTSCSSVPSDCYGYDQLKFDF